VSAKGRVRVGASGWVYPHWRGLFYPAELLARRWLSFCARTFDAVEVNNSFYRLPSEAAFTNARQLQAKAGLRVAAVSARP
jgi:uncharacterized protein YecE (DUF72 family)